MELETVQIQESVFDQTFYKKNRAAIEQSLQKVIGQQKIPTSWDQEIAELPSLLKCKMKIHQKHLPQSAENLQKLALELRFCQIVGKLLKSRKFIWISDAEMISKMEIYDLLQPLGIGAEDRELRRMAKWIIRNYLQNYLTDILFRNDQRVEGVLRSKLLSIESMPLQFIINAKHIVEYCRENEL